MSIDGRMDREDINTMEYCSAIKKEHIQASLREVDEPKAYYGERKTNIVYEHMHLESRKMVLMNPFAEQQWRCRHRK